MRWPMTARADAPCCSAAWTPAAHCWPTPGNSTAAPGPRCRLRARPPRARTLPSPMAARTEPPSWFGGQDAINVVLADTWEFDGANWTRVSTASAPVGRRRHALAYDSARGRTVLFGGVNAAILPVGDTWEFDGANWTLVTTATAP